MILDPAALQAQGITAAPVNHQLRQSNLNAAGGRAEVAGLRTDGPRAWQRADAYDLSQTADRRCRAAASSGWPTSAKVKDAYSEQRSIAKMNGRQVISFQRRSAPRARPKSPSTTTRGRSCGKIEKDNPQVHFAEIYNSVDYTKKQYTSAMEGMLEGAVLAVLVVLLFLRDIRATLISALAIPLSAIPAFWFMSLMGITLNGLSLLALSLVAGVLVDDAIVEIENIVRHMRMGKSAYQAALDAADEIGLAVLATTMSIVAVFLPVALMPGISGQFFKAFGFTVVVSVLMSLARRPNDHPADRRLFPALARRAAARRVASGWICTFGLLHWSLDTTKAARLPASASRASAERSCRFASTTGCTMVGAGFGALFLSVVLFATLPMTFQPSDQPMTVRMCNFTLRPARRSSRAEAVADRIAAILRPQPEVERVYRARSTSAGPRQRGAQEGPQGDEHRVRALARAAARRDPRCPRQLPEPERRRARRRFARHHAVTWAARTRCSSTPPRKRSWTRWGPFRGFARRASPATSRSPKSGSSRASTSPRTSASRPSALSQTIRIATMGDIEQNSAKFSLSDRQIPITVSLSENAGATFRRSRTCRFRPRTAVRCR